MTSRNIAESLLDLGAQVMRKGEIKKLLDFLQGENQLLNYLYKRRSDVVYPKDISNYLEVSPARIALLLNRMEREGWIKRSSDFKDSRRTIVKLTDEGIQEFKKRKVEVLDYLQVFIDQIGIEDASQLLDFSHEIIS